MTKYFYNKYNSLSDAAWVYSQSFPGGTDFYGFYRNITWNGSQWVVSGTQYPSGPPPVGSTGFVISGGYVYKYGPTTDSYGACTQYRAPVNQVAYSQGSLVQSNIIATDGSYPANGRHTDGYWYIKQTAQAPTSPSSIAIPQSAKSGESFAVTFLKGTDAEGELVGTEWDYSYDGGVVWIAGGTLLASAASFNFSVPIDKTKTKIRFRLRSKDAQGLYSAYTTTSDVTLLQNSEPTVVLNTLNSLTLYENDTFTIEGSASDMDNGNILNVKYQLNSGTIRALATAISNGSTPITFNKQLTCKAGKLFDGETPLTDALVEGTAHTLKVWAEDDQGGKSTEQIRTFYVVPNRAPLLTVDPFTPQSDMINNDTITISGTSSDPDGNDVTVNYKLNNRLTTEILRGVAGPWSFNLKLKDLIDGENMIVVEVIDSYNFKVSKTIKLNKTANLTPLTQSKQRYKITPPTGSAQGVLLWIQREEGSTVSTKISMTTGSEQEQFVPMTLSNSAPVGPGIVEDEFTYQATGVKDNIYVELTLSGTDAVTLVSGVLS
ncbi:hypothetical protein [Metabacillus fastidiosus]|uniref:Uncharacterized protein n=1 Tax=Metabacillus fastidiosus TaxID=1458 RepID=A0ABU6NVE9_9BACI|nr:hypothetical protein [Metabacillus fastidiosus]